MNDTEPRVTHIRVEYDDGSFDDIENLPQGDTPFYGLGRKGASQTLRRLGLHTSGAVAAILFVTAFYGQRREYSVDDPEILKLLKAFSQ